MGVSGARIVALALYTLVSVLVIFNGLHWARQFWLRRQDFGFDCRHTRLIWTTAGSLSCWVMSRVMTIWLHAFIPLHQQTPDGFPPRSTFIIVASNNLCTMFSFLVAGISSSLRVWLIYYDCCLAAKSSKLQWLTLITAPVIYQPRILATAEDIDEKQLWQDLTANQDGPLLHPVSVVVINPSDSTTNKSDNSGERSTFELRSQNTIRDRALRKRQSTVRSLSNNNHNNNSGSVHAVLQSEHAGRGGRRQESTTQEDWFFREKPRWGNRKWLRRRLRVSVPLIIILCFFPQLASNDFLTSRLVYLFTAFMFLGYVSYLAYRFPAYNDSVQMVAELKLGLCLGCLLIMVEIMSIIIDIIVWKHFKHWSQNDSIQFWKLVFFNTVMLYFGMGFFLLQTKWVCLTFDRPGWNNHADLNTNDNNNGVNGYNLMCTSMSYNCHSEVEVQSVSLFRTICCTELCYHSTQQFYELHLKNHIGLGFNHNNNNIDDDNDEPPGLSLASMITKTKQTQSLRSNNHIINNEKMTTDLKTTCSYELTSQPDVSIHDVIADDCAFNHFMTHLFGEFSYESLLCVIQLQQFSERFRSSLNDDNNNSIVDCEWQSECTSLVGSSAMLSRMMINSASSEMNGANHTNNNLDLKFAPCICNVKSSIVWDPLMTKEQIFVVLCQKYILQESEMSVNISFRTRSNVIAIRDFLLTGHVNQTVSNAHELSEVKESLIVDSQVFDSVKRELVRLMRDSLTRFICSAAFKSLSIKNVNLIG